MSENDTFLEAIRKLIALAREFEEKGDVQSALETYQHALSQLPAESPLKEEIEIAVKQLDDRSKPASEIDKPKIPNRWLVQFGAVFVTVLLLVGVIAIAMKIFNADSPTSDVNETSVATSVATPYQTSTSVNATPQNTALSPDASNLSQTKIVLTIKADHVYLRAGPHINHPGISKAYQKGTQMEVLGRYDDWYYVKSSDDENGWLWNGWVTIDSSLVNEILIITQIPTPPAQPAQTSTNEPPYP